MSIAGGIPPLDSKQERSRTSDGAGSSRMVHLCRFWVQRLAAMREQLRIEKLLDSQSQVQHVQDIEKATKERTQHRQTTQVTLFRFLCLPLKRLQNATLQLIALARRSLRTKDRALKSERHKERRSQEEHRRAEIHKTRSNIQQEKRRTLEYNFRKAKTVRNANYTNQYDRDLTSATISSFRAQNLRVCIAVSNKEKAIVQREAEKSRTTRTRKSLPPKSTAVATDALSFRPENESSFN